MVIQKLPRWFAAILAVCAAVPSPACTVQRIPLEQSEREAASVVVAKVVSAQRLAATFRGSDHRYALQIESVERGRLQAATIEVHFERSMPHLRGATAVCPLRTGTGIEADLQPGMRYRLYLDGSDPRRILLARPMPQADGGRIGPR